MINYSVHMQFSNSYIFSYLEKLLNCMLRFRIMLFMQQKIKIDFTF